MSQVHNVTYVPVHSLPLAAFAVVFALQKIRAAGPNSLPAEADKDIHDAYDNHANGYITKPGSIEALAQIVETIEQFWIAVATLPKVLR